MQCFFHSKLSLIVGLISLWQEQWHQYFGLFSISLTNCSFSLQSLYFTYHTMHAFVGIVLSNITAILLGIMVSMNIYVLRHSHRSDTSFASFFSGSTISVISSTCASCSSLGFLLVSVLGGAGVTASTILSNY
jgi:hypothetical protein